MWLTFIGDDSEQAIAWNEVDNAPHEAEWSEELIGAAAAYQAAEKYEEHVAANGKYFPYSIFLSNLRMEPSNLLLSRQARKPGSSEGNPPWACGCFCRQNRRD